MASNTHSALSPSQSERWWNCPGSIREAALRPSQPSSAAAAEGTACHALAEDLVTGKCTEEELQARLGEFVHTWDGFDVPITQQMIDGAILYARTINEDLERMRAESGKRASPVVGQAEVRVVATSVDNELHGTADHLLYQKGNRLIVTDLKFGKKAVNPKENKQMGTYAVGAMDTIVGWALDEVWFRIVQPRAGGNAVRVWRASMEWLKQFREDLRKAVKATRDPKAPLNPGAWCYFCPANTKDEETRCSALLKRKRASLLADFEDVVASPPSSVDDALAELMGDEPSAPSSIACDISGFEADDALAELLGTAPKTLSTRDPLDELM